jgi:hypothetical protein
MFNRIVCYRRPMNSWRVWVVGLALAACTKPNPAATCADGTCIDPNFPICDVDGSLTGDPGTCVSMGCTGGEFKSCSDTSTALVCAADGSKFESTTCALGCDPTTGCKTCTAGTFQSCQDASTALTCDASGADVTPTTCPNGCDMTLGCRACMPSQTTCANGITETCDAAGNISGHEACVLGCSSDATRCATLDPSNNLGMFYDMTADPQDLTLSGSLDLKDGKLTSGGTTTTLTSFSVAAPTGGAPIRVFVGKHVTIGDLSVIDSSGIRGLGRAIAVLATGDLDVTGRVSVTTGAVDVAGCTGSDGTSAGDIMLGATSGAGGGGHASAGAAGGAVPGMVSGAPGGTISGSAQLVPLRGGCPGGRFGTSNSLTNRGGGAIQLVSLTAATVTGTVVVDGTPGTLGASAGGGGGGILIEAPSVTFDPSAKLLGRGGGGTSGNQITTAPLDDAGAPQGALCGPVDIKCGVGGNGAAPMTVATMGGDTGTPITSGVTQIYFAGSGGGGIGRIRINTSDANFATSASVIVAADLTAGVVGSK